MYLDRQSIMCLSPIRVKVIPIINGEKNFSKSISPSQFLQLPKPQVCASFYSFVFGAIFIQSECRRKFMQVLPLVHEQVHANSMTNSM